MQIKGKQAVLEAIHASHPIRQIVISSAVQTSSASKLLNAAKLHQIPIQTLSAQQFKQTYPEDNHQGVIADISNIAFKPLSTVLDNTQRFPAIVLLDHLEDPHNMGAIIRTCEGLGVNAVIFPKDRQVKLTSGVVKSSSGAIYHLPLVQVTNTAQTVSQLSKAGYWIYAADERGDNIYSSVINHPFVLVVGNEHKGVSKRISKMVDLQLRIPMQGQVDSLNVSVATGIILSTVLKP